jgi:hypothetical protein
MTQCGKTSWADCVRASRSGDRKGGGNDSEGSSTLLCVHWGWEIESRQLRKGLNAMQRDYSMLSSRHGGSMEVQYALSFKFGTMIRRRHHKNESLISGTSNPTEGKVGESFPEIPEICMNLSMIHHLSVSVPLVAGLALTANQMPG